MKESSFAECIVCKNPMTLGLTSWHGICRACGYEKATLEPAINEAALHEVLDEDDRETALKALRKASFKTIVTRAMHYRPNGRLLDVGSAHGWFLEEAAQRYDVLGLEPDRAVFSKAAARGLNVRNGYFPDALETSERFDVIVFNDVIEHIPKIENALDEIHRYLAPEGILILNLPCSRGLFYRMSKWMVRLGARGPFERMWQKGLPSPHVHYFNDSNLDLLVQSKNFIRLELFELPSVRSEGLLERIRCVGSHRTVKSYLQYIVIRSMIPFLKLFKSDIIVAIFRNR